MAAEGQQRTDLSDIVRSRMEELGLSYRRLEELCVDPSDAEGAAAGEALWKRGTLENLAKGRRIKPPDAPKLQALAAALGLPFRVVQEASGRQFYGVDTLWSADGKVRALVEGFDELDDDDQARVLALMNSRRRVQG